MKTGVGVAEKNRYSGHRKGQALLTNCYYSPIINKKDNLILYSRVVDKNFIYQYFRVYLEKFNIKCRIIRFVLGHFSSSRLFEKDIQNS